MEALMKLILPLYFYLDKTNLDKQFKINNKKLKI